MDNRAKAIVLGGTFPHITLIKKLQKRGFYVILLDYYENPPAKPIADEHIQESTLDKEAVLKIAKEREVDLVISTCIDQANVTACYVGEKLGLSIPYNYKTALNVTDKSLMKAMMMSNKIPTSRYQKVSDLLDLNINKFKFPLIVKPVDSNSSKGVKKIQSRDLINKYLSEAIGLSRDGNAIIEEFIEGKEIGIDCYIKNGKAEVLMVKERRKIDLKDNTQQIYGCFWPDNLRSTILDRITEIATDIAKAFNLDNTPLMIQAIANNNDINVIEFAPRIGGGESFRIIKLSTGFDIVEAAIDSYLNKSVEVTFKDPTLYYVENFIYAQESKFKAISGFESLLNEGTIEYIDTFKSYGTQIGKDLTSNNRVGVFTVKGSTKEETIEKIQKAVQEIEVYDVNDQPIMIKSIY